MTPHNQQNNPQNNHPYEEPFLILLLGLAVVGLLWLFFAFIPAIVFAVLIATATYPLYQKLIRQSNLSTETAAFVMTGGILSLVILPITYLFIEGGHMGADLLTKIQQEVESQPQSVAQQLTQLMALLPLPETWQGKLHDWVLNDLVNLTAKAKEFGVKFAEGLFAGVVSFVAFVAISLFSLFFFYRDGERFSVRIKNLSPLTNHLDGFIMRRFADLSTVLTISVLGVAILQGLTFALLMSFFDLPALFLGIAFAMASFIPIVGGALIWLPVAVYFVISDQVSFAIITALYSVLLIGILIDNLLRPIIIRKLSSLRGAKGNEQSILSHTWLTMLSTLAGLIHFGVMGLVFGPMLAAMAITIFDVYEHKHRHQLDYS